MTGRAVLSKDMGFLVITALVFKLKRSNGAVFHASAAAQTLFLVNHRILAA